MFQQDVAVKANKVSMSFGWVLLANVFSAGELHCIWKKNSDIMIHRDSGAAPNEEITTAVMMERSVDVWPEKRKEMETKTSETRAAASLPWTSVYFIAF